MNLFRRALCWLQDRLGVELGAGDVPVGPPHVYVEPKSSEEWWYGKDHCIYCARKDPKRTRYTDPPCSRNAGEIDA